MCEFFSITSDGRGNIKYFNWRLRKKCMSGRLRYNPDSHTSVNDYFGFKGALEDFRNKYEYNPLTGSFSIDQINSADDSKVVEAKVRELDFSKVVPGLIIKPIMHPLRDVEKVTEVTEEHIELLKEWVSVRNSVWDSVWESVWDSIGNSVGNSVATSVWETIWDSVGASVRNLVQDSTWDSLWAYLSSFFRVSRWECVEAIPGQNPYQCAIDLWEMGLVPSFDGKTWRLHSGKNADIVWSGELK